MTNSKIKFHLDENVDGAIAKGLRRRNIDVTTTKKANLIGASDEQQAVYALNQNRVIFTHDDDFLRLSNRGIKHAGIIYCRQGIRSKGNIVRSLEHIYKSLTPELMMNHIEFI